MILSVMRNEDGMLAPNPNAKVRELSSEDRKTVFAGDLTKKTNSVSQIRERAQKKAQKLIGDVFDSEKEMEETLRKMRDKCDGFVDERVNLLEQVQQVYGEQDRLMEDYDITEDSAEYQDLQLLRKERDAALQGSELVLTEEEEDKLANIHEKGITQFQQVMLEKDEVAQVYLDRIHEAEQGIVSINSSLRGIQIERLKEHPMIDAQKNAQELLLQASKEIIGELRNEAVEHIQEKLDEVVEKAQEEAAKKKEEEEKLEELKESQSSASKDVSSHRVDGDMQEVISAYQGKRSKADQELKKMMDNLELILEDIKGAEVDVNL